MNLCGMMLVVTVCVLPQPNIWSTEPNLRLHFCLSCQLWDASHPFMKMDGRLHQYQQYSNETEFIGFSASFVSHFGKPYLTATYWLLIIQWLSPLMFHFRISPVYHFLVFLRCACFLLFFIPLFLNCLCLKFRCDVCSLFLSLSVLLTSYSFIFRLCCVISSRAFKNLCHHETSSHEDLDDMDVPEFDKFRVVRLKVSDYLSMPSCETNIEQVV